MEDNQNFMNFSSKVIFLIILVVLFALTACSKEEAPITPQLLVYGGMNMAGPLQEIADIIEEKENCKITILLDGSKNLLEIISVNMIGDLYLPGSDKYINKAVEKGHISDTVVVGNNYPVLIVAKNNPKKILPELKSLADPELRVVLGNPNSGFMGLKTSEILKSADLYDEVMNNILYLTTDSKATTRAVVDGDADISLNWKATVVGKEAHEYVDYLSLNNAAVLPEEIKLGVLKYSLFPEIVRSFINYAVSDKGQEIFRSYGL